MAIARFKKIHILGLLKERESILEYLQESGCVEIIKQETKISFTGREELQNDLNALDSVIRFLSGLKKNNLFFEKKNILSFENWQEIINNYNYRDVISKINSLRKSLDELCSERKRLQQEYSRILPYSELDACEEELLQLKDISFYIGKIRKKEFGSLIEELEKSSLPYFLKKLSSDKQFVFLIILCLKDNALKLDLILNRSGFKKESIVSKNISPLQTINQIKKRLIQIEKESRSLKEGLVSYIREEINLKAVFDYLYNLNRKAELENILKKTLSTFIIEGWVKESDAEKLKQILEKNFSVAVYFSQPLPEDDVPVFLENKPLVRPFEVVTQLYGMPLYKGIDPSAYLSIFFVLSFALCLTDAGYGLLLSLFSFYILKKFRLSSTTRKFFQLFLISGVFTVILGSLTGGWFGNLLDRLSTYLYSIKKFKDAVIFLDPLREPLKFLLFVLILGYLQVTFGIFLKLLKLYKDKDYFSLFFMQLPTFLIQISLMIVVLTFVGLLPQVFRYLGIGGFFFACILFFIYNFKIQKNLSMRLFWSVYGIYGIITGNFLADTLSFSRLFALGLTTGLLATAINEIVFLVIDIFNSLRFNFFLIGFFATILFVFAHTVNLAINLLGAYVHTSRLQYLEYFSKFFEAGGRQFRPFKKDYFYTEVMKVEEV